jgi:acyl-CoA thioester hydrolase
MKGASTRVHVQVRYGETDKMGVVYHGNYFRFFEVARVEILRGVGFPHRKLEEDGILFVVSETGAKYVGTAGYDDVIEIYGWIADLGKASVRFEYEARHRPEGRLLATGYTVLACVDRKGKVQRLPEEISRKLAQPIEVRPTRHL